MKKIFGSVGATALALGIALAPLAVAAAPPRAAASGLAAITASPPDTPSRDGFTMGQQWAREFTRYGDQDASAYSIDHVHELQYRLRWAGKYHGPVSGYFGDRTLDALQRYQKREGLRQTRAAGHNTWAHLIRDTIRRRGVVPPICRRTGWHACYDRQSHQVTLWHGGQIRNSWLVRGGDYGVETRLGNTKVYYRNIDHVSAAFDSPMPYSQFFDGGQAYHGSAFMIDPFVGHSHGCINMYIEDARQLWRLTSDKKLYVTVYGAWS